MVKFRLLVVFVVSVLFFSSCDNELKLLDEWKDIPVVYGVLSPNDTAHYIRVEKAFLDPEKSAFEVARIADSLYYPDEQIEVFVKNVSLGFVKLAGFTKVFNAVNNCGSGNYIDLYDPF